MLEQAGSLAAAATQIPRSSNGTQTDLNAHPASLLLHTPGYSQVMWKRWEKGTGFPLQEGEEVQRTLTGALHTDSVQLLKEEMLMHCTSNHSY